MKLKSLFVATCLSLVTSAFALGNHHTHPQVNTAGSKPAGTAATMYGSCEIEIINASYNDVRVSGVFDDGSYLPSFFVYRNDRPQYIDLFYYGYCHSGMNLYIDSMDGYRIYSGWTPVNETVTIVPYLLKQMKVELHAK